MAGRSGKAGPAVLASRQQSLQESRIELTLRDTRPDLFEQGRQDPPKARLRRVPLYAGLLALLGVGVFFGVQAVTSSSSPSTVTTVSIPPPPKIVIGAQASQS